VKSVFSHQEIGNKLTYDRDLEMKSFFNSNDIIWNEFQMHGVIRKLKSRQDWDKRWEQVMRDTPKVIKEIDLKTIEIDSEFYDQIRGTDLSIEITTPNKNFQRGGEYWAWRYLDSFVKERYVNYSKHISKPALSRKGCSRLSPYLTYGNISMRISITKRLKTNERFSILFRVCIGIAILCKNLKTNAKWNLKTPIAPMILW
jgi:deoxyribodipyrimidine photo-lyase